ncbi:YicC/YloC family endoribonuclease [Brevibacillus sp. B_LB10_24]|uniref:YicC/YloC family endoribonuclease n=1 Tax=Brevibacillus sp. B_LB10_24 TaxID=3380645 RepID=UPI0038BD0BBA
MIRSMTGYGRQEEQRGDMHLAVELRSVNHRYGEVIVRMPRTWAVLEDRIKQQIAEQVYRGRVEAVITIEKRAGQSGGLSLDWELAEQYVQMARQLQLQFSLKQPLEVTDLLRLPGIIRQEQEVELTAEELAESLLPLVTRATVDLVVMRQTEGEKLQRDLLERLMRIADWNREIGQLAPSVKDEYVKRLEQRISELSREAAFPFDQQRVIQEAALFAERVDISEETTRLGSHCAQFSELLGGTGAVGRKLDFLLQEMNREANTIGSKANYLPIQRLTVEIKTELEKMREQVQNIE